MDESPCSATPVVRHSEAALKPLPQAHFKQSSGAAVNRNDSHFVLVESEIIARECGAERAGIAAAVALR